MNEIYLLHKDERELYFRTAAELMKIRFEIIEKDYWVAWILERLFSLEKMKSHLTFKGGTSLSKVYGVINRFSEDIDLSIEREILGFGALSDPENAPSKKKQTAVLKSLSTACSKYVQTELLDDLKKAIAAKLGTNGTWEVYPEREDPEAQTLLFEYPSATSKVGYIRPLVKIEIGARSEHWPVSEQKIQSYAKEALKEKIHEPEIWVRVLNAERTFWEKATILHQYAHLPEDKKLPPRISRHYYDFFRLLNSEIKEKALKDIALLERVAIHKSFYFASSWANYGTARKGTLKLLPPVRIINELEKDYDLMEAMFFREIPDWKLILKTIENFEKEFNKSEYTFVNLENHSSLLQKPFVYPDEKIFKVIIVPLVDPALLPGPQRKFVTMMGEEINESNALKTVWCQPLDMIDFDRPGETKYEHDKLYDVILMYITDATARTFVSHDSLRKNSKKTELPHAQSGTVFTVPGYFLNDWNNKVHPVTGQVYCWFQPVKGVPEAIKSKMIAYAKTHKF